MKPMTYDYVQPEAFKTLFNRHGAAQLAKMIGLTDSALRKMIAEDKVRRPYELAARHLLSKEDKRTDTLAIVRVPPDKAEAFNAIMAGLNLELVKVVK